MGEVWLHGGLFWVLLIFLGSADLMLSALNIPSWSHLLGVETRNVPHPFNICLRIEKSND
jgi:hypothetical protein